MCNVGQCNIDFKHVHFYEIGERNLYLLFFLNFGFTHSGLELEIVYIVVSNSFEHNIIH